jgi:hypothetical protein
MAFPAAEPGVRLSRWCWEFVSEVLQSQATGEYHLAGAGNISIIPNTKPGKAKELLDYLNEGAARSAFRTAKARSDSDRP